MKKIKSIFAVLLAIITLFGIMSVGAFAEESITNLTWNEDCSVSVNFDGAVKFRYNLGINNYYPYGYGCTENYKLTREKIVPYMMEIARNIIKNKGTSGVVSFDLRLIAEDANKNTISKGTVVSKSLNINDVAEGKLAPDTEQWKYISVSTSDTTKLSNALYAAYEPLKNQIAASGVPYETYIMMLTQDIAKESYYVFKGTLAQVFRFGSVYSEYCYSNIQLDTTKISEVKISLNLPKHGQSVSGYASSNNVTCDTKGVTVKTAFKNAGVYEINTNTTVSKFYSGNVYKMEFMITFDEGYAPADKLVVYINGHEADMTGSTFDAGINGFYINLNAVASGNFFQNIITFFHNLFTKQK